MQNDAVPVIQADRDAAADMLAAQLGASASRHAGPENARSGARDSGLLVQAFARHRLAASTLSPPAVADVETRQKLKYWFFKYLSDEQRRDLVRTFYGVKAADEAKTHGAQRHVLRAIIAALTEAPAAGGAGFQARVQPWLLACFGEMIAGDREERNHRFLEEALELVQACGCSASEAHQLVDYTFGRPIGEPAQEVGGVMVTLAALCLANGLDMHDAAETELSRIWIKVEQIRAKQAAKPKHSPLPEATTAYSEAQEPGGYPLPSQVIAEAVAKERERCARIAEGEARRIEGLPDMSDRRLIASNADRAETAYKITAAIRSATAAGEVG